MCKIEIEKYNKNYVSDLNYIRCSPEVLPHILADYNESEQKTEKFFSENKDTLTFIIKADGIVSGYLRLTPMKESRRKHILKLSIATLPQKQGLHLGTRLMEHAIEYVKKWTYYSQIQLTVIADNQKAINLYRKFGFEVVGTLKQDTLVNGHLKDVNVMQLIVNER